MGTVFAHDITAAGVAYGRGAPAAPPAPEGPAGAWRSSPEGERTMATYLGVASTLEVEDLDEDMVARAQVVYLEGYLWDLPPAIAALRRAMEVAPRRRRPGGAQPVGSLLRGAPPA